VHQAVRGAFRGDRGGSPALVARRFATPLSSILPFARSRGFRRTFNYNNYKFLAAGEAVAAANHDTYENVIQHQIFDRWGCARAECF
jgi:hypothetical protein